MRRLLGRLLLLAAAAAAAYAAWRALRVDPTAPSLQGRLPGPQGHHVDLPHAVPVGGGPESDEDEALPAGVEAWVEPIDGQCPPSHPVKAKLTSGIYHLPGSAMYARTKPDRCYLDAASAEADGLRPAKR